LQVDQGDAEVYLQQLFPIATKIVYLPDSFSSVAKFLAHKPNGGTYHQNVIKNALVEYCFNYAVGFDALATNQFLTHCSVVDWCVNIIIDNYVAETAKLMSRHCPKATYLSWCNDAKACWSQKQNARLREEACIGSRDFFAS